MTDEPAEAADAEESPGEESGDAASSVDASREPVEEPADSETGMGDFELATDSMESDESESEDANESSPEPGVDAEDETPGEDSDLQEQVEELEAKLAEREEEIEDLQRRLKRKQADFENYKKRAKKRQKQIRERATEDFVERVVTVRDNLLRALDQDEGADIRDGIEATLAEFDRILADENVEPIEPDLGTEVDPVRHEVLMRVESDQPVDTIADVYQPGYEMAEKVVRPAQVTVSDGPPEPEAESTAAETVDSGGETDAEETTESSDTDGSEPAVDANSGEHEDRDEDEE